MGLFKHTLYHELSKPIKTQPIERQSGPVLFLASLLTITGLSYVGDWPAFVASVLACGYLWLKWSGARRHV
jgi:hypothetical protein